MIRHIRFDQFLILSLATGISAPAMLMFFQSYAFTYFMLTMYAR
jgi:hypothetical protein